MKAMIFAAGLGTRLKPITDTMPKALVPVGGTPLLEHVIRRFQDAGINDFVVNVHHFADQIIDYVNSHASFGSTVAISDERGCLLETGGGILHAKELLMRDPAPDSRFVVHNVDILSDLDLGWFISQWRPDALATLLVSSRDTQRYLLFNDGMRLVGWTNIATGEVRTPYASLDVEACRRYAFAGIHQMSNSIFGAMESEGMGERFPIMDFYLKVCDRFPIYGVVPQGLRMIDVGKLNSLDQAECLLRELRRSCPSG